MESVSRHKIKHILIMPSWYKTESNPVLGSFFEEQARGLIRMGYKVGILHLGFKPFSSKSKLLDESFNDAGLPTIQKEIKAILPKLHNINYIYYGYKANQIYNEYIKVHGIPDIIHAHSVFYGGIAAHYISKKNKIPFVITEHLTNFITGKISNTRDVKIARKIFISAKVPIVVSNEFRNELSRFLKLDQSRIHVIHNMVSPLFFENRKKIKLVQNKPIIFFSNSFITTRKNHPLMLKAFKLFHQKFPNSNFIIGGDATNEQDLNYKYSLIKLSHDLGIHNSVTFLGALSRIEVKKQLDRCHVFLLASSYETFGVVLIEALASGRPIITTDSKGPRDIVNEINGFLVTDFNEIALGKSMIDIIQNYDAYNQEKISDDCKNNFSEINIISKLLKVYESSIN